MLLGLDRGSRADGSIANVGPDDLGVRDAGLDLTGDAGLLSARATGGTGLALLLRGVDGVEPQHVGVVLGSMSVGSSGSQERQLWRVVQRGVVAYIIPDGHDQNHGHGEGGV